MSQVLNARKFTVSFVKYNEINNLERAQIKHFVKVGTYNL